VDARIKASNFSCTARDSRFCVFWIRNTIRNVTIVVAVLMTSCHVVEKRRAGPRIAQTAIVATAAANAHGDPTAADVRWANRWKMACKP